MSQLGSVRSKQMQLNHITDRGRCAKPQLLGNFCDISEKKKAILTQFDPNFASF